MANTPGTAPIRHRFPHRLSAGRGSIAALFILTLINLINLTGCNADMAKFEWRPTESGPRGYPMEIISGSLKYHDGSGSSYVPNGVTLHHGWGKGVSSHVLGDGRGKYPLPNRLVIHFFSYTEDQFYRGDFELPYEKILALFQAGHYSPNEEEMVAYDRIVVGVSPGGGVAVWLWGIEKNTEVFFGLAEKTEGDWKRFTNDYSGSREKYVKTVVNGSLKTPERIAALRKNGVPLTRWADFRARYDWQPLFTGMTLRDARIQSIDYFNGERDYLYYPLKKEEAALNRAVPSKIGIYWNNPDGRNQKFYFTFDEAEILSVFKTLSKHQLPITLEFSMRRNEEGQRAIYYIVHTEKEAISLKSVAFKAYLAKD